MIIRDRMKNKPKAKVKMYSMSSQIAPTRKIIGIKIAKRGARIIQKNITLKFIL
jgi:hypothetical protein